MIRCMTMTKVVNLTPHPVNLRVAGTEVTVPPSGTVARCSVTEQQIGTVVVGDGVTIPLVTETFGDVTGLPDPQPGTLFIVSRLVADACRDRDDLVFPTRAIRDDEGRIVAAGALGR